MVRKITYFEYLYCDYFIVIPLHSTEVNNLKQNQCIIFTLDWLVYKSLTPYNLSHFHSHFRIHSFLILLLKGVTDGRTDRRAEKHGSFYNMDLLFSLLLFLYLLLLFFLLLLLFSGWQCKAGRVWSRPSDERTPLGPISPKTPTPQYQPIDRKKRKGKTVEDKKW